MTGISTAANSLFVIQHLVFERKLFSLEELVACLRSNWGAKAEIIGLKLPVERIQEIRTLCMSQPKFGHGEKEVDELAWLLMDTFYSCMEEARNAPVHAPQMAALASRYDSDYSKFEILIAPGVGTFEQYIFGGSFAGATADGRPAFDPIASDLSPAPLFSNQDPFVETGDGKSVGHASKTRLAKALKSYSHKAVNYLSDGAPSDFNIPEDYPHDKLVDILKAFAKGQGSNVMTITVADPQTLRDAAEKPDQYDLLRVRMGGWTEFFITLFPDHKSQHQRRPLFIP